MTRGHFRGCLRFFFCGIGETGNLYIFFRNLHLWSFVTIYTLSCFPLKWRANEFFPRGHPRRSGVTLKRVSKVSRVLLWFCFTSFCNWFKIPRDFFDQSEVKLIPEVNIKPIATCSHSFSRAWRGYMYLLRVLIGSLGNLCLLWLAGEITLDLVLRHSFCLTQVLEVLEARR